ncbi:MAG TPA: ATP-binding protein, partial [Gemmatimonadaceae bacterium]|nr:ATP-binding protein [Gemmatimonadaceae bacterium]
RASGRHLLGLINEVLDFSKLEAGHVTVDQAPASAVEALAASLGLVRPQAALRGVELRELLDCEPGTRFLADADRVRQVLVNLLSNAIKFTADGGWVEATCGHRPSGGPFAAPGDTGWVFFRVRDTGIGIATDEQERVFDPFVQVDGGHTRRAGGTGLGLTISRRLARLMGGEITLESKVGQGSTFTLWLPATTALEPAAASATLCNVGLALKANVEAVSDAFVDRLRADPALPMAVGASHAALEDHTAALVIDLAQHLVIIDEGRRDTTTLIRDGVRLQRRVSELHGAQRFHLGWPEETLVREHAILREVIDECLRTRTPAEVRAQVDDALQVMHVFIDQAMQQSREGWRRAARRGLRAIS